MIVLQSFATSARFLGMTIELSPLLPVLAMPPDAHAEASSRRKYWSES